MASNNNYTAGETIPNFVVVHADASGDVCVYTTQQSHLIWDQVATTTTLTTTTPVRIFDSRSD